MSFLAIERVCDVAAATRWHAVAEVTLAADHVGLPQDPLEGLLPSLQGEVDGDRIELWLGLADGAPVAVTEIEFPLLDNTGTAVIEMMVDPRHRRRGYGRQMLHHALNRVRAAGRHLVIADIAAPLAPAPGDPPPGGALLAADAGARMVLSEVRRMLDLSSVDADRLARLRADAAPQAAGYSVVQWLDRAPPELYEDMAALVARMSTDAPLEDMTWEPEVWTAERYRAKEDASLARGRRRVLTAVRHEASGRLVGYTDIGVNARRTEVAYQWDTIVTKEHRGHRLGLLLKAANLELLRASIPGVRYVNTWNAASNTHMVAINDALGFQAMERVDGWQLDLST
jgi:GNAT superfamily N-acetyltransferase